MRLDLGIADRLVPWHDKMASITPLHQPDRGFMHVLEIKKGCKHRVCCLAKIKRLIGGKPERFLIASAINGSDQDSALLGSPLCFLHLCRRITRQLCQSIHSIVS